MRPHASRALLAISLLATALRAPAALNAQTAPLHLIPQPRQVTPHGDQPLPNGVQILCPNCDPEDTFAADDLRQTLADRNIPTTDPNGLRITLGRHANDPGLTPEMKPEGYLIQSGPNQLTLTAATAAGLFYAAQTAKQLVELDAENHPVLHAADIRDYPVLRYRGLHDDQSRGPVNTLDFGKKLIRTLAAYKANVYSPYFEHTQAYASNPLFAPPGGAMSAEDARELVAYAAKYHVTVIPEQEAFGHLHHNLLFEQYATLAETPHGAVLAPGQPGSLQLISQMFTELAALYPSPFLHIGADETIDLGHGQTKPAVDAQGLAPVYLSYLQQIDKTLRPLNRRLLWWGDIAQDAPDLVKALPAGFKHDTVAVAWWYNPRPQGFARYIKPFTDAGIETWVAPGINNWSRVYPNWNTAIPNIQQFTLDGVKLGATGQLNTVWYDDGEALASNNYFGILFGAAQAWQGGTGTAADFEAAYGPVFHGDLTGKLDEAQKEIMAAHALLQTQAKVGDASDGLFWLDPWSKDGQTYATKIRPYTHEVRLHAERALTLIAQARAAYPCPILYEQMSSASQTVSLCTPNPGAPSPRRQGAKVGGSGDDSILADTSLSTDHRPLSTLREPDALDALELGARRIDFIGLKFQLADEIPQLYAKALADAASPDKKTHGLVAWDLADIRGLNGKLEDIVDSYSLFRDLYAQLWLRSTRAYALRPVLEHYDATVALWYNRIDHAKSAQRQWDDSRTLPPAADLGLPPAR